MLAFEERGKPEYPEKSLLEQQGREPTTDSTHVKWWQDLNPGHISGRRVAGPGLIILPPLLPNYCRVNSQLLFMGIYSRWYLFNPFTAKFYQKQILAKFPNFILWNFEK